MQGHRENNGCPFMGCEARAAGEIKFRVFCGACLYRADAGRRLTRRRFLCPVRRRLRIGCAGGAVFLHHPHDGTH